MDIIIIELRVQYKSQEILRVIRKCLANVGKLLFVWSMSVDVRDSLSETQCQRFHVRDSLSETQCQTLNVRDSMSETQCQRLNVRESMSESDLLTWSHVFATTRTSVYNLILVYEGIVDLSYLVFHPWTAARPSVHADWLLRASVSCVVLIGTKTQISLVQLERPIGYLHGTRGGTIRMVVRRI